MRNEATQRALLTEADLTYERALEIATAREAAARDGQAMSHPQQGAHFVQSTKSLTSMSRQSSAPKKPSNPCAGCGGSHWRNDCPFKNAQCFGCHRKGHLQKVCYAAKSKPKEAKHTVSKGPHIHRKNANYVDHARSMSSLPSTSSYDEFIFNNDCSGASPNPILLDARISGASVQVEVDTGASRSILSTSLYYSLWHVSHRPSLLPPTQQLLVCAGNQL